MTSYRERLWPAAWVYLSTALVIPASLLVFLPINTTAGVIVAIVLYAAIVMILSVTSPLLRVTETDFIAGKARIPRVLVGRTQTFTGEEATLERGQRLDARAWLVIRGWISPVARIEVLDANDPAPYWLVSTRHPVELAQALDCRALDA